jgi:hypothetical protein
MRMFYSYRIKIASDFPGTTGEGFKAFPDERFTSTSSIRTICHPFVFEPGNVTRK